LIREEALLILGKWHAKLTHMGEKITIRASKLATHSEKRATT
jgi:hypothetical protein